MLPTFSQYKKWSLPSKYAFWGLLLACVPIIWSLTVWIIAVPEYAVLAFNYGTSEMTIYGDAGDSPATAVIIRNANSHEAGIKAEYYWIRRRYPGYRRTSQGVFQYPEPGSSRPKTFVRDGSTGISVEKISPTPLPARIYDVLVIRSWYGRTREVFYDINTFWNKGDEPRDGGITPEEATRETRKRLEEAIKAEKEKQKNQSQEDK